MEEVHTKKHRQISMLHCTSSRCSSVCGDSQCRTVEIEDTIFEAIPQELLIKAALIAASELDSAQISKAFVKNGCGKDSGRH
jgi:uncharacterized protein DUF2703